MITFTLHLYVQVAKKNKKYNAKGLTTLSQSQTIMTNYNIPFLLIEIKLLLA